MAGFSTSAANAICNFYLRGIAMPTVRTLYFALFTSDPTDDFTAGTEVNAPWYARQPAGAFSAPANGVSYNATNVQFPPLTGSPVTVTHIGLVEGGSPTDSTSTLVLLHQLPTPKTLTVNDVFDIQSQAASGDFTVRIL